MFIGCQLHSLLEWTFKILSMCTGLWIFLEFSSVSLYNELGIQITFLPAETKSINIKFCVSEKKNWMDHSWCYYKLACQLWYVCKKIIPLLKWKAFKKCSSGSVLITCRKTYCISLTFSTIFHFNHNLFPTFVMEMRLKWPLILFCYWRLEAENVSKKYLLRWLESSKN